MGEQVPLAILHFIPPHKALWPHTQLQYYISQYCLKQNYTIFILNEKCEGFAINMWKWGIFAMLRIWKSAGLDVCSWEIESVTMLKAEKVKLFLC